MLVVGCRCHGGVSWQRGCEVKPAQGAWWPPWCWCNQPGAVVCRRQGTHVVVEKMDGNGMGGPEAPQLMAGPQLDLSFTRVAMVGLAHNDTSGAQLDCNHTSGLQPHSQVAVTQLDCNATPGLEWHHWTMAELGHDSTAGWQCPSLLMMVPITAAHLDC